MLNKFTSIYKNIDLFITTNNS